MLSPRVTRLSRQSIRFLSTLFGALYKGIRAHDSPVRVVSLKLKAFRPSHYLNHTKYTRRTSISYPYFYESRLENNARSTSAGSQYLATLERFLEPLASADLDQIIDILPGLMNAVKMIHTIAR